MRDNDSAVMRLPKHGNDVRCDEVVARRVSMSVSGCFCIFLKSVFNRRLQMYQLRHPF